MSLFTLLLLIGLGLFVLFSLASRFTLLRSFMIWLARPIGSIADICQHIAMFCKKWTCNALECSTQSRHIMGGETNLIGTAITRLVAMLPGLCVIIGVIPLDVLRSSKFYGTMTTILHLPLDIFQGAEWVLVSGCFLYILTEAKGFLSSWMHFFPALHTSKVLRWAVGLIAGILLASSLLADFFFNVWGQCVVVGAPCAGNTSLQIYLSGFFGALTAIAVGTSVLIALLGVITCAAVLLALLAALFFLSFSLLSILEQSLAKIGLGAVSDTNSLFKSTTIIPVVSGSEAIPLLPGTLSTESEAAKTKEVLVADNKRYQVNSVFAFEGNAATSGSFSYRFLRYLLTATEAVGALGSMVAMGLVTLDARPERKSGSTPSTSITMVSPTQQEIEQALAHHDSTSGAFHSLAHLMVDKIVHAYGTFRAHGNIVVTLDLLTIHDVEQALREMKERLTKHSILIVTTLPEEDQRRDKRFLEATNMLIALEQEAIIATTILLDVRSSLAKEKGEKIQEEMAALTIASLFFSHLHDTHNLTAPQTLARLGNLSPFIGMSMGSSKVSAGQSKRSWSLMRWLTPSLPQKGIGDLNDAISQSKALTRRIVEEEHTQAITPAPDLASPFFILYIVPLRLDDPRFQEYANQMRAFLARTYPMAQAIIVRGNGTSDAQLGPGYYVQAATLYPLSPATFHTQEILH